MTSAPIPVFINPVAGRGQAAKSAAGIRQIFQQESVHCDLIESRAPGDIERQVFAAAKSGIRKILVAGGDGSVHEAVNGICRANSNTALGVIPVGTGNDFAKAAAIPLHWQDAASGLAERLKNKLPVRQVDVGKMNERFFANGAGIGFDAKINRIARDITWPIGDMIYLVAVFRGICDGVITPSVRMRYGDTIRNGAITLANISNGPWVGGMFHIAPMARIDDGSLDLVFIPPVSSGRILALLPKLIKGTHIDAAEVSCSSIETFELESEAPIPSHLDGEVQPLQTTFNVRILKGALHLV
jgi:diacylglycerol kinase (ATP)